MSCFSSKSCYISIPFLLSIALLHGTTFQPVKDKSRFISREAIPPEVLKIPRRPKTGNSPRCRQASCTEPPADHLHQTHPPFRPAVKISSEIPREL